MTDTISLLHSSMQGKVKWHFSPWKNKCHWIVLTGGYIFCYQWKTENWEHKYFTDCLDKRHAYFQQHLDNEHIGYLVCEFLGSCFLCVSFCWVYVNHDVLAWFYRGIIDLWESSLFLTVELLCEVGHPKSTDCPS